ncbi:unnamed protein product [Arabis nemorensis]|uniref:PCI domain-containing protein n=1 Tax=Arabis nemorensis TaxID=586526 RepID=A0A565BZE1_9BRAS|nr:unnamed protein product [Arabis nemorensis]
MLPRSCLTLEFYFDSGIELTVGFLSHITVFRLIAPWVSVCSFKEPLILMCTWSDYKCNADQVLKLKQLTLLTLAETNKVLPYETLMVELDITNVRELEDFLINECMYAGIVRGKVEKMLSTSEDLLVSIQDKIEWADNMSEVDNRTRKEAEETVEEVKKSLFMKAEAELRGHEEIFGEPSGVMDYEEDRSRPKRRRHSVP